VVRRHPKNALGTNSIGISGEYIIERRLFVSVLTLRHQVYRRLCLCTADRGILHVHDWDLYHWPCIDDAAWAQESTRTAYMAKDHSSDTVLVVSWLPRQGIAMELGSSGRAASRSSGDNLLLL
jgi:hypothetical protein